MAITCGFYNSQNHDRMYDADQISKMFDGIFVDGVIRTFGNKFAVTPSSGMRVNIGTGRAWFNHTWTLNDATLQLTLDNASNTLGRIDAVVLEVNRNLDVRDNDIKIIKGTESSQTPAPPILSNTGNLYQYPLAYIDIPAGTTSITEAMIRSQIGTEACPWCAGVLPQDGSQSGGSGLITKVDLPRAGWVTATGEETGENWYKLEKNIRALLEDHPTVFIAERQFNIPTKDERKAYGQIEAVYATSTKLIFYALKVPTVDFSVYVTGIA